MAEPIPTVEVFKNNSSGGMFAQRASDPILSRIDALLQAFWEREAKYKEYGDLADRLYTCCELFWALDGWLKEADRNKNDSTLKARRPGVQKLYESVAHRLAEHFYVTVNVLPRELENMYGKEMVEHGKKTDLLWVGKRTSEIMKKMKDPLLDTLNPVYKDRATAQQYRVFFKGGLAYQMPWWEPSKDMKPVKVDTVKYFKQGTMSKEGRAGFVLGLNRDLYIAQHFSNAQGAFYHSSYLAGGKVQCAGELKIVDGKFTMISNYSGHYQPGKQQMLSLVETLKTNGVDLKKVVVLINTGKKEADNKTVIVDRFKADAFLTKKGTMTDADKLAKTDPFLVGLL